MATSLGVSQLRAEGWQFSFALQGRLRRDGTIVELTVDKSSAWAAVTRGPESGKLKNLHC
jgi:hypothetical protein